jgi:hypothetical protein
MKLIIAVLVTSVFLAIALLVIVPSYGLLTAKDDAGAAEFQPPPNAPAAPGAITIPPIDPKIDIEQQIKAYTQVVAAYVTNAYSQQAGAYGKQIDAYKSYVAATGVPRRQAIYDLVVKGTLVTLLNTILTTLLAFAFVKAGANVLNNVIRVKAGQPVESFRLLN